MSEHLLRSNPSPMSIYTSQRMFLFQHFRPSFGPSWRASQALHPYHHNPLFRENHVLPPLCRPPSLTPPQAFQYHPSLIFLTSTLVKNFPLQSFPPPANENPRKGTPFPSISTLNNTLVCGGGGGQPPSELSPLATSHLNSDPFLVSPLTVTVA